MQSRLRSFLFCFAFFFILSAHAQENTAKNPVLVEGKYSLKEDREAFEQLRKDIPQNVRAANDEKAFLDSMMTDLSVAPSEVRSKFTSLLSKKRESFQKDMTKKRGEFSKIQARERETFSKNQENRRKEISDRKLKGEERSDAYEQIETRRRDFSSSQQDRRDEFEEQMREARKNFDDYARAKQDEFNQRHRDYTARYQENQKHLADTKKIQEEKNRKTLQNAEKEYEAIQKKAPVSLGVESEEP